MTLIQALTAFVTSSVSATMLALLPAVAIVVIAGAIAIRRKTDPKPNEPPMVPYLVPFLGSAIPFMGDYYNFLEKNAIKNDWGLFSFVTFGQRCVSINDDLSVYFFKYAKQLQWDPVLDMYMGGFGVPSDVIYLSKSNVMHEIYAKNLASSEAVDEWLTRFLRYIHQGLVETLGNDEKEWKEIDLFQWCSELFFKAVTLTLYGEDFPVDEVKPLFQTFDDGIFKLLMGWPKFTIPKVYAARDAITKITAEYLKNGGAKRASKIVQVREKLHEEHGVGWEARASLHLMLFWATHTNSPRASFWCLAESLQSPPLLSTVRKAIAPHVLTNTPPSPPTLDIPALVASAPLSSLLHEVFRVYLTGNLLRVAVTPVQVGPYTIRKGDLVLLPLRHLQGCPVKHPEPGKFVWDRFIDKASGECKVEPLGMRPFGGGALLCPGKTFAKLEIMAFLGTVLAGWDIEILEGQEKLVRKDVPRQGVLGPERDIKVRVKRRSGGLV